MNKAKLKLSNIFYSQDSKPILRGSSIEVESGKIISLLGPNGSGKTTNFYIAAGFMAPDKGQVLWNDKDITSQPLFKRAKMGMGYLSQESCIFKDLPVSKQVDMVLSLNGNPNPEKKRDELLSMFRLEGSASKLGYMLSGGERRRLEVLCVLACDPKIVLMDEPFAGVDPIAIQQMKELILMMKDQGLGVLITDHNARVALEICDYNYIIYNGFIEIEGNSDKIRKSEKAKKFYLGKNEEELER